MIKLILFLVSLGIVAFYFVKAQKDKLKSDDLSAKRNFRKSLTAFIVVMVIWFVAMIVLSVINSSKA